MEWGLGELVWKDEYESVWGQWEIFGNGERTVSESLAIFKQWFWNNIGCLILAPTFGLGGLKLLKKEDTKNIGGNKRKRYSIRLKVYFYEVCLSYFIY